MSLAEAVRKQELQDQVTILELEARIDQLLKERSKGDWTDLNWLKKKTGYKSLETLKEKLLYPFRLELEGSYISYPAARGEPWKVNAYKMEDWLVDNFSRVTGRR